MTDIALLRDIERRLREATGPDRRIDNEIAAALVSGDIEAPGYPPAYTASLDACAALHEKALPTRGACLVWSPREVAEAYLLTPPSSTQRHADRCIAWLLAIVAAVIAEETQ